jgi:hypothetical protein
MTWFSHEKKVVPIPQPKAKQFIVGLSPLQRELFSGDERFKKGYLMFFKKVPYEKNPYNNRTDKYDSWAAGWLHGESVQTKIDFQSNLAKMDVSTMQGVSDAPQA